MDESLQRQLSNILQSGKIRPGLPRKIGGRSKLSPLPPGREVENAEGKFHQVLVPFHRAMEAEAGTGLTIPKPPWHVSIRRDEIEKVERPFFFDLETTGFSSTPMFLISSLLLDGDEPVIVQRFARDYSEEAAVIAATIEEIDSAGGLVSFNGKSYDLPFLRNRAAYNRLPFRFDRYHADLLHICRREWKGKLPDFKLQTLEKYVVPLSRADDIPSAQIPELYHRYVRQGYDPRMGSVFRHNLRDVITMVRLFALLIARRGKRRRKG